MAMRVSGINSGLDTDAIVQELVSAYSKKTEKYEKEQTKLGWKQDIWKSLNSKVYSLYTKISNMRYSSAYAIKTVNSSDTTKATVSASGNAVNGTHKLNVLQTAQSAYLTGGKVASGSGKVTSETTLKDLGFTGVKDKDADTDTNTDTDTKTYAYLRVKTKNDNGEWENHDIKLSDDSTIEDVTKQLQDAGLNASFDENQGRFYISSKGSGANSDFEIAVAKTVRVPKVENGSFVRDPETNEMIYEEVPANKEEEMASERLVGALGLNSKTGLHGGDAMKHQTPGEKVEKRNSLLDLGAKIASGTVISYTKADGATKTIEVSSQTRIDDIIKKLQEDHVNVSLVNSRLVFQDDIKFSSENNEDAKEALQALGLPDGKELPEIENSRAVQMSGQDAVIVLDEVQYTNSSNEFSINGLNITAQGVTDVQDKKDSEHPEDFKFKYDIGNAITINTNTDTQGLYDTVKNFLTEYNNIINEITKLYNADSSRGYDPLTDEEKDAMSDTEISKWETKIKDSLLRRDNSLSSIMSAMITSMNTGITIGDKTYSLSTFGIHTMGYLNAVENEQNAFHIDGDSEDENTSGNKDYLMAAIKEDPDTVIEFMKQLTTNLYNAIDKQMQGNSLRSRFKIYNDKELDIQYKNYTTTIKEWEKKVSAKEDYYYKKFSQMETALAKLNSQQSSLSGLLGN